VRHLTELMGGEVGSQPPGAGATFWLTLPLRLGRGAGAPPTERPMNQALEVLIADDLGTDRNILAAMARALGWRAETVDSARQLRERLRDRLHASSPRMRWWPTCTWPMPRRWRCCRNSAKSSVGSSCRPR
jgi:hypothetical protein